MGNAAWLDAEQTPAFSRCRRPLRCCWSLLNKALCYLPKDCRYHRLHTRTFPECTGLPTPDPFTFIIFQANEIITGPLYGAGLQAGALLVEAASTGVVDVWEVVVEDLKWRGLLREVCYKQGGCVHVRSTSVRGGFCAVPS